MIQSRGAQALVAWAAVCLLVLEFGCSRNIPTQEESQTDRAPFQATQGDGDGGSSVGTSETQNNKTTTNVTLPFHEAQTLPAGTLLTVRLKDEVSVGEPGDLESFEGTLDEPVVVNGKALLPRDTAVSGRLESFRTSRLKPVRRYVRLALESVQVSGFDVPLQTASLYVRLPQVKGGSDHPVRLQKHHLLTFRLSEPTFLAAQRAQVDH